ncbi:hypothetical protein Ancab_035128 [Ancistrocladus abbreviatus]
MRLRKGKGRPRQMGGDRRRSGREFADKSTTKGLATQSCDSSHSMPFNNSDQLQLRNGSTGGRSSRVPNGGRHHTVAAGIRSGLGGRLWLWGKGLQREDGSNLKTSCRSAVTNWQAHASIPRDRTGKLWRRQIWAWVKCS